MFATARLGSAASGYNTRARLLTACASATSPIIRALVCLSRAAPPSTNVMASLPGGGFRPRSALGSPQPALHLLDHARLERSLGPRQAHARIGHSRFARQCVDPACHRLGLAQVEEREPVAGDQIARHSEVTRRRRVPDRLVDIALRAVPR